MSQVVGNVGPCVDFPANLNQQDADKTLGGSSDSRRLIVLSQATTDVARLASCR
jgi:hypothetical protein